MPPLRGRVALGSGRARGRCPSSRAESSRRAGPRPPDGALADGPVSGSDSPGARRDHPWRVRFTDAISLAAMGRVSRSGRPRGRVSSIRLPAASRLAAGAFHRVRVGVSSVGSKSLRRSVSGRVKAGRLSVGSSPRGMDERCGCTTSASVFGRRIARGVTGWGALGTAALSGEVSDGPPLCWVAAGMACASGVSVSSSPCRSCASACWSSALSA